jgi:hypothetical protein
MAGHANVRVTLDMYVGATAGVLDRARAATEWAETPQETNDGTDPENNAITSDRTPHSARLIPGSLQYWEVSYLPGIRMEYDDACMAMTIADKPCLGTASITNSEPRKTR